MDLALVKAAEEIDSLELDECVVDAGPHGQVDYEGGVCKILEKGQKKGDDFWENQIILYKRVDDN